MDYLEQALDHLDGNARIDFRAFLLKEKVNRKDLALFEMLCDRKEMKSREIAAKLYQPLNLNAYHSLRKRLMSKLFTFIVSRRLENDSTKASSVMGMISMSQFMLENRAGEVAKFFMQKAEALAVKNEQFELLNTIYNLQIANIDALSMDLDHVINKWQANSNLYNDKQRIDVVYAKIRKRLSQARKSGTTLDPEEITSSVFNEFNVSSGETSNARFMHKIVSMMRTTIVSTKDYHRFEPFIIRVYTNLKKKDRFSKADTQIELGFLYMIAHAYYRNRKFDDASRWLDLMENMLPLQAFRASHFYEKFVGLRAAVASYSGKNTEAIEIIKGAQNDKRAKFLATERLNMDLNLAVYYFQSSEFRKAHKAISEIHHSNSWLDDKMGMEWRFKKNMIELIIQVELGHEDIALSMIKNIEKSFIDFFNHPIYQRAGVFLGFIKRYIEDPEIVTTKEFAEEVKQSSMGLPGEKEDLQAISFFCWLKSKMLKRNYYEVLIETIQML